MRLMDDDDWKWLAVGGVIATIVAGLIYLAKKVAENQSRLQRVEHGQSQIRRSINEIENIIFEFKARYQTDIRQILSEHEFLHKRLSQLETTTSIPEEKLKVKELEALLRATTNDKLNEKGAGMYVV